MRCDEIQNKLPSYLDNELDDHERAEIEQHLLACSNCAQELKVLTSVDAIGKMATFPAPAPAYWKQLRRNIMQQIATPSAKTSGMAAMLARFRGYLWPGKISYRLVGLAAAAAIVLLVVHRSLLHQDQLVTQDKMTWQDSTEIAASTPPAALPQSSIEKAEQLSKAEHPANIVTPARNEAAGWLKGRPPATTTEPITPSISEHGQKITGLADSVPLAAQQGRDELPSSFSELNQVAQPESDAERYHAPVANISNEASQEKSQFRLITVSEKFMRSAADSSTDQFDHFRNRVQAAPALSEKISIWEKYRQSRPASQAGRQATYELARLYFQLATEAATSENIKRACAFYDEQRAILFLSPDSLKFKEQYQTLQSIKKRIKN